MLIGLRVVRTACHKALIGSISHYCFRVMPSSSVSVFLSTAESLQRFKLMDCVGDASRSITSAHRSMSFASPFIVFRTSKDSEPCKDYVRKISGWYQTKRYTAESLG